MRDITIRPAHPNDLDGLTRLYNHYVEHSPATFDIGLVSRDARREWMSHYHDTGPHRLLVSCDGDSLIGYACSSALRPKPAYATSVETTIYLAPEATGRGLGRRLYGALFEAIRGEDLHRAYAAITSPNPASEALHRALDFRSIGTHGEVGRKFGRYWDVQWFEKPLP